MPTCPDCRTDMLSGFCTNAVPARLLCLGWWHPGEVQQRRMLGVIPLGIEYDRQQEIPVTTYRCPECGLLRSYAR
jgi:hypothetical protein